MKILVLGVTGMLGKAVFSQLSCEKNYKVFGTLRNPNYLSYFPHLQHQYLLTNIDILDHDTLVETLRKVKPDVVVNCIGLIKQFDSAKDPLVVLPINSILPHRLAKLCDIINARLIHISTDCVFSGNKGFYEESDVSDAEDLYGRSKFIGEVHDVPHALTLRTSIIGHGIHPNHSLIDWFLAQSNSVRGYSKAIFSGLPTIELARVIQNYVIPDTKLYGLYHVAAEPIDKLSLLQLVAEVYEKEIEIYPEDNVKIDRSLNSYRFRQKTGYSSPSWIKLIKLMHENR